MKSAFVGAIKLLRVPYWLMTGGISSLTAFALHQGTIDFTSYTLIFFSMAFISSGGFALNDFFDKETDVINKPNRPIPSGEISPKTALAFSVFFFLFGLSLAFALNWVCFLILVIDSALLILYSPYIKRTSGAISNILISGLIGTAFLYGEAAIYHTVGMASLSLYPISLGHMGGGALRDILSLEGDSKVGYPTLPQKVGVNTSMKIAGSFFAVTALLSPLPFFLQIFGWAYLLCITVWSIILLYSSFRLFTVPSSIENVRKYERLVTMSMVFVPLALVIEGIL